MIKKFISEFEYSMHTIDSQQIHEAIAWGGNKVSDTELRKTLEGNKSLQELVDDYPYIKQYGKIFAIFMIKWITEFSELDQWDNAIIIQGKTKQDKASWYVIKIPKPGTSHDIEKELMRHTGVLKHYYEWKASQKDFFEDIIIPQVSTNKSLWEWCVVMDMVSWSPIQLCLFQHYFSPLFEENSKLREHYYMDEVQTSHELYNDVIDNELKKDIMKWIRNSYDVLDKKYQTRNPLEIINYISGWHAYNNDNLEDIYKLVTNKKRAWELIVSLKKAIKSLEEGNLAHNDLHGGNLLLVPDEKKKYKLWIIDFAS